MHNSPLLSEFLTETDTQIRVFDLGRRVQKLSLSDFQQFERAEKPYAFPFEQNAWLGILFWNVKDKTQHNIWFIRMPLDETGCIQLSARDEFMHMLLSRLGDHIQDNNDSENLAHVLKDNPYVFKPTEEKMAVFHSKAQLILKQDPSKYFEQTISYLEAKNYEQWQTIGLQGIADLVVRLDDHKTRTLLIKALAELPNEVFAAICQCLENQICSVDLAQAIKKRIDAAEDESSLANGIRALARCESKRFTENMVQDILTRLKPNQSIVLVAIIAKSWEVLNDQTILKQFLERLAINQSGPELFNALIMDLMFIPGFREKVLAEFRDTQRSENLSIAVGQFFQSMH